MMFVGLKLRRSRRAMASGAAAVALLWTVPAFAQQAVTPAQPSDSAMVNLVRLLIEQGVLTPEKGKALMDQAQAEAVQARAAMAQAPAVPVQQAAADLPPPPAGTVRVPYVPETVRNQIKEELRKEVLAQAKTEGWAAPGKAAPDWVDNIRIHGDLRFRSASAFYAKDNSPDYINVPEFNATGPIDLTRQLAPRINTTRDKRNNMELRARIGLEATVADRFTLGFQLATGNDPGPISTNATLTGGFRKRDLWLQNAYVKGELVPGVTAMLGRFDNPFRTTDLMFDPDLALDGLYGEANLAKIVGEDGFTLAVRGGAFPIMFEDPNYPSTASEKRNWRDRYLFSGQLELAKKFGNGVEAHLAGAYHNFTYLRGHVSAPCDIYSVENIECSTDALRPLFATKGNTLMFLRRFDTTANPNPNDPRQPQYLGLKFAYRVLDLSGSVSVPISDRVVARLTGNYLYNFGFNPKGICAEGPDGAPLNNVVLSDPANNPLQGACDATKPARFVGGNQGYGGYFSIGDPNLFSVNPRRAKRGAWAVNLAYKYLESDAVPDSFTDSDFHLGGTNARGFVVGGAWAPFDGIALGARWLSANQIVDAPLAIDVLHLDLSVAF
jgi:Putative porin